MSPPPPCQISVPWGPGAAGRADDSRPSLTHALIPANAEQRVGTKGTTFCQVPSPPLPYCPVVVSTGTESPAVSRDTIVRHINKTENEISGMSQVKEGQQGASLQAVCQKPWSSLRGGKAIWKVTGFTFHANYWRLQAH